MSPINLKQTGILLKKLRKDSNLTQKDLASYFNVSKPAISQWESGKGIKTEYLYRFAKFFDVTVSELILGKLDNETNIDYIQRNYDLESYDFNEEITDATLDKLKEFYSHCDVVRKRFFTLLPKWAKNQLTSNEIEEFQKLKTYFKFDSNYWRMSKLNRNYVVIPTLNSEKEFINEKFNQYQKFEKEYEWELSKLYTFIYDIKIKKVIESQNTRALQYLLDILNQPEKDIIFNQTFSSKKEKSFIEKAKNLINPREPVKINNSDNVINVIIEHNPIFQTMIDCGCNCLKNHDSLSVGLEEKGFHLLEGKIEILDSAITNDFNWKLCSYQDYISLIDVKKNHLLHSLIHDKENNPLLYYENLISYYKII